MKEMAHVITFFAPMVIAINLTQLFPVNNNYEASWIKIVIALVLFVAASIDLAKR